MKLKAKIQLFSSLFMLILLLLINTAIYFLFYKITVNRELDELTAHTNALIETLNDNPDVSKKELLSAYLPNDGMIRVIQKDSKPLHQLTKKKIYTELDGVYTTSEIKQINTTLAPENIAIVAKPMIWENGEIVTLQLSKHLVALHEDMRTLFYVLVVASLLMLIPTMIAGKILSQFLLRPIQELISAMKENIKTRNWKKIALKNRSRDELYEMEETFNQMIDHLEENFQKQERFVSDASHELRTPISIIKSYAQLLERRGKDHPQLFSEAIEAIDSETERMQKLIDQMLLLAKSKAEIHFEKLDFVRLCEETVKHLQEAYKREMIFQSEADCLYVHGNQDQLQQIIYILVNNALKYSDQEIELNLYTRDGYVVFQVKDYGPGISKEDQERIFDRFYRVDQARSRDTGGTGLGLPIAKTIAKSHHGELSVSSTKGNGSTFIFQLPHVNQTMPLD